MNWLLEFFKGYRDFTDSELRALELGDRLMDGYVIDMEAEDVRINDSLTETESTGLLIQNVNDTASRIGCEMSKQRQEELIEKLFGEKTS